MFNRAKQYWDKKRFRLTAMGAVALSFLFAGLLVASPLHLTSRLEAGAASSTAQVSAATPGMPGSFADLAQKLGPTVVNIKVTKVEKVGFSQESPFSEGPYGDLFKRFFREMPRHPENFRMQGAGSGVIIGRDGYVLTNNHVVEGAKEVTVTLADKQEYKARVVGRDSRTDLAVLKIDPREPLTAAAMGDSDQLRVGDWVLAIGNPFGLSNTVTSGIVSAKGRVIGAGPYDDFIQTDAPINPGNSGGPLFDMKGEVVGINTAILSNGQGIGFAIPVNEVKPLVPQMISKGGVTRGYLGVSIQPITSELSKAMKLENSKGALVADVVPGSPADKAGIHPGDVIVAFNNKAVEEPRDLSSMVARTPVGQEAHVTVLRDGTRKQLAVKVEKLDSGEAKAEGSGQPSQGKWGLGLQDLNPGMSGQSTSKTDRGVLVASVQPGSPADLASIHQGDILLGINRQPVSAVKEAMEAISKAKDKDSLLLLVKRGEGNFFTALTL
jgi:serine protease Do